MRIARPVPFPVAPLLLAGVAVASVDAAPDGRRPWAVDVSLAPG